MGCVLMVQLVVLTWMHIAQVENSIHFHILPAPGHERRILTLCLWDMLCFMTRETCIMANTYPKIGSCC